MDASISVAAGDGGELMALSEWLTAEDELRGRVRLARQPIAETQLGALADVLTVALGAGGTGTVLASSSKTWLQVRRTTVRLTITTGRRSISMDVTTAADVEPLLADILNAVSNELP
jgi:hypothetical protein